MNTEVSPTPEEQGQSLEGATVDVLSQGVEAESPAADVGSDSSPDEGVNKTLLDVAREAVAPPADESDSPSDEADQAPEPGQDTEQSAESEPEAEQTDEFTDEELGLTPEPDASAAEEEDLEKLPFGKHPRFKELIQQRNEYRDKVQEFEADAGQHRQMREYLDKMELSEEEAANAIVLAAQLKHAKEGRFDADQVLQRLSQMQSEIATRAGKALPPDIQEKVDEGLIDDDAAKELAQARVVQEQAKRDSELRQQRQQQDEARQQIQKFTDTATRWEAAVKARDPDYEMKKEAIADYVKAMRLERGNPSSAEDVLMLLRDAYRTVNARFGRLAPKPEPKAPNLSSDRSHAPEAPRPQPKTLLDAARQGLQEAQARSL